MQDFIDYLEKGKVVRNLKQFYKVDLKNHFSEILLNRVIKNLRSLNSSGKTINGNIHSNLEIKDFDVLGKLFEKTRDHKEKKKLGEFYTPAPVVKYILDAADYQPLKNIEIKKIIDVSCGSGSFLIQAIRILIKRCLKIYKRERISDLSVEEAKDLVSTIKENIIGIDINQIACILCQINIHYTLFEILNVILSFDPNYRLPWFNIKNLNAFTINDKEKYDYVIGNPPYLFIRDISSDQRQLIDAYSFETNDGQYDYYQLFIELGIRILINGGMFGYIIPDSLLALSHRSIIRKYIYNRTKIKEIYHTGPKFSDLVVSNIIIILEKEKHISERKTNLIKIKLSDQHEKTISQNLIEKWDYKFLIHLNEIDISILNHLSTNFPKLKDLYKKYDIRLVLGRGVELTKTGKIIFCESCKRYFPIPQKRLKCQVCHSQLYERNIENIIYETIPADAIKEDFQLYLYSIRRYQKSQYKYINTSKTGINYKDFSLYEDRIVIRQLSQNHKICAAYDKNLSLTSQSMYNLKVKHSPISEFNNFYLLGLFNSMLFSYFFIKSFGTYKKLFPRILVEKIKDFPIKIPITNKEKEITRKIIEKIKFILENTDELEHLQKSIDFLIFDLYQISKNNRKYIVNYMKTLKS